MPGEVFSLHSVSPSPKFQPTPTEPRRSGGLTAHWPGAGQGLCVAVTAAAGVRWTLGLSLS